MKNNKIIRFVQSLVLLPIVTVSMPMGPVKSIPDSDTVKAPQTVISQKLNIGATGLLSFNQDEDTEADKEANEAKILKIKAEAIDTYFEEHDMPLKGMGEKMAKEAENNDLDWRLIAAISVRESTGGKFDCKKATNNAFGWGSCKISFKSNEAAIETVARNLGGNNPKTAHHYDNKTTVQILRAYNPPSVVPRYAEQVISIMNDIGPAEVTVPTAVATI
jgi:hypothetical protein